MIATLLSGPGSSRTVCTNLPSFHTSNTRTMGFSTLGGLLSFGALSWHDNNTMALAKAARAVKCRRLGAVRHGEI